MGRYILWNYRNIPFLIKLSMYSVFYLYMYWLVISYLFNIICYSNNLFWCSNYPQFSQWWSLQAGFCIILTYPHHSLSTWFLVQKDVLGSSCTFPGNSHLSKMRWFLLVNYTEKPRYSTRHACSLPWGYYCSQTSLGNICIIYVPMYVYITHILIYFYIYFYIYL